MNTDAIPLGRLEIGASATVVGYSSDAGVRRFVEMGFVPGTTVTAIRTAPMGDPTQFAVMGSKVAIRRDDANIVMVTRVD